MGLKARTRTRATASLPFLRIATIWHLGLFMRLTGVNGLFSIAQATLLEKWPLEAMLRMGTIL